jgi:hypothetical protein
MKVPVAGVSDQAYGKWCVHVIALRLDEAFSELRDWHADVRRPGAGAGPERQGGVVGVVSCLPQPLAIFQSDRPFKAVTAALGRYRLHAHGLFPDVRIAIAMKLE